MKFDVPRSFFFLATVIALPMIACSGQTEADGPGPQDSSDGNGIADAIASDGEAQPDDEAPVDVDSVPELDGTEVASLDAVPTPPGDPAADCAQSKVCETIGGCVPYKGLCLVQGTADEDCQKPAGTEGAVPCDAGQCHAQDGVCVALTHEDCQNSWGCEIVGTCAVSVSHGTCWPAPTQGGVCNAQMGTGGFNWCDNSGECTSIEGVCHAATDEDCQGSIQCGKAGRCVAQHGTCWVPAMTDADCQKPAGTSGWSPCKLSGACHVYNGVCRNGSVVFSDWGK